MAQLRVLLVITANLVLIRLACATSAIETTKLQSTSIERPKISVQSLGGRNQTMEQQVKIPTNHTNNEGANVTTKQPLHQQKPTNLEEGIKSYSNSSSHRRHHAGGARQTSIGTNNWAHLLVGLIKQLEKVDVSRLVFDYFAQMKDQQRERRQDHFNSSNGESYRSKQRINPGFLAADAGSLFSITKQLVKLAKSHIGGREFGGSPWILPAIAMPPVLAAASQLIHDIQPSSSFHHAVFDPFSGHNGVSKTDWFWMVAPAAIVIGAGIIVVPMIAAWIVSNLMTQNTFTVSAGRRRKKRDVGYHPLDPLSLESTHPDVLKLLNVHQILGDETAGLLVEKLSRFHSAIEDVAKKFA